MRIGLTALDWIAIWGYFVAVLGLGLYLLVAALGIIEVGRDGAILARLPEAMKHLWATTSDPAENAMGITWYGIAMGLGWVLSFGYWTTDFLVVQRAFSARDLRSARLCPIAASFFKMALPLVVVGCGLVAYGLHARGLLWLPENPLRPGQTWNDAALPMLLARYYPPRAPRPGRRGVACWLHGWTGG